MKQRLFADSKITTTHQTVIDGAVPVLDRLRKMDAVDKIVIGPIEPNKSSTPRIKCNPIRAGLLVKVQTTESLQQFYVYTNQPEIVREKIRDN